VNNAAVSHSSVYPDIYVKNRHTLVFKLHTARGDLRKCELILFERTKPHIISVVVMEKFLEDGIYDHYKAEIAFEEVAKYQKYYFVLYDGEEGCSYYSRWEISKVLPKDGFFEFLYANESEIVQRPKWSIGQVYYQIFPDRFSRKGEEIYEKWGTKPSRENYMGGNIQGIISKLGYLEELGIDCIYLNPIFLGDFNHKYATTDYFLVDPLFGNNEDLKELVKKAHRKNIKIILDGVFNHTGVNFKAFQDILQNQEKSKYKDWYYIKKYPIEIAEDAKNYECVGDYGYMPKLNTANPSVREYILSVMVYWIEKYNIDGWRLDVADEVDESVWLLARRFLKDKFPNIILLGETWGDGLRLMSGNQMDYIMNYVFRDAVRDFVAKGDIEGEQFAHRISSMLSHYPHEVNCGMFLPLDSHDTERFLYFCEGNLEKLKLAVLIQMMMIGSPSIYYGDEVGMTGENDPDCRRCMNWENPNEELYHYYRKLINLRKNSPAIQFGSFAVKYAEGKGFAFVRSEGEEKIYVICNGGDTELELDIPVAREGTYIDIESKKKYLAERMLGDKDQGKIKVRLEKYQGIVIRRTNNE